MSFRLIIFSFFLFTLSFSAAAQDKVVFCNSCITADHFRSFGEGAASVGGADEEILVINHNTDVLYTVVVLKERHNGYWEKWGVAYAASQQEILEYLQAKEAFQKGEHILTVPPGTYGAESFSGYERQSVGTLIVNTPWYQAATRRPTLFRSLNWLFGKVPVAVVVFPNGDVAKFNAVPSSTASVCCDYI